MSIKNLEVIKHKIMKNTNMSNLEISWVFQEMADLLEIKGENFFKIKAYRNAAKIISKLDKPLEIFVQNNTLDKISGIGKAISSKIKELLQTGSCSAHKKLLEEIPKGVLEIRLIPGIGNVKARILFNELNISSLEQLENAAQQKMIRKLPGMSAKFESDILRHIKLLKGESKLISIGTARELGTKLVVYLSTIPGVTNIELGGSIRRWKETVSDIDIIAATTNPQLLSEALIKHPRTVEVLDTKRNRVRIRNWWNIEVDLSITSPDNFAASLHRNTGSKHHYSQLQKLAEQKNMVLSNPTITLSDGAQLNIETETDIYYALGMQYIPPELREGTGEIEAAVKNKLPDLIKVDDIKGDLHAHTFWSDAADSIEDMVKAAKSKGYSYIAITDHSVPLKVANGLDDKRLKMQCEEIEKLQEREKNFTILTGVECDILSDGSLAHPDEVLSELDVVVASVHSDFKQDKKTMTERIISAIKNEHVDIIGHVTGRLLEKRIGYEVNLDKVFEAATKYNTAIEINSSHKRLDLNTENAKKAKQAGVKVVINTDAHEISELNDIIYGTAVARRAWLTPNDVLNTLDTEELLRHFK